MNRTKKLNIQYPTRNIQFPSGHSDVGCTAKALPTTSSSRGTRDLLNWHRAATSAFDHWKFVAILINAAIAARFEPRKPLFSVLDIGYSSAMRLSNIGGGHRAIFLERDQLLAAGKVNLYSPDGQPVSSVEQFEFVLAETHGSDTIFVFFIKCSVTCSGMPAT